LLTSDLGWDPAALSEDLPENSGLFLQA